MTIPDMKERFGVKVGVSDHSMTNTLPITAVALGATVVEKHIILDRNMGGPDSAFSMEPEEFASMVKAIREVEEVLGEVSYPTDPANIAGRQFSRSLYIAQDMNAGDVLTKKNLLSVRPGYGLAPKYLNECLGKRVNCDLSKGTRFDLKYIE